MPLSKELERTRPAAPRRDVEVDRLLASAHHKLFGETEPVKIDRYTILEILGVGGMGRVYAAYDPELDRKVAIKLLTPGGGESAAKRGARWLREAQAIAKVVHPNVITVYDAGTHAGQVYIAMEYLAGGSLAAWLRQRPRSWQAVVEIFSKAGRGLAAAHEVGLVHRDFKPDNVLVGRDGRVRVVDFGLARLAEHESSAPAESLVAARVFEQEQHPRLLESPITRTGAVLGTPAYMAPEQHRGGPIGPGSDQFGFCVALYEALYRERPFAGSTLAELSESVESGRIEPAPRRAEVPQWLRRVIVRGLSSRPASRWPTMAALLSAIERGRATRRRRWLAIGLAAGAAAIGVAESTSAAPPDCDGAVASVEDVWNDAREQSIQSAFAATGEAYAASTWSRVETLMAARVEAWEQSYREACEATHVRHERSTESFDRRMACMSLRLRETDALLSVFADADASVVEHAVSATRALDPVTLCGWDATPASGELGERAHGLEIDLARARALERGGQYREAVAVARDVLERASGEPSVAAEAELRVGGLELSLANYAAAERHLESAFFGARLSGRPEVAMDAALELILTIGDRGARHADARRWARHAKAELVALGSRPAKRAELLSNLGLLLVQEGDYRAAATTQLEALQVEQSVYGADDPRLAKTHERVGTAMRHLGQLDDATEHFGRALSLREPALGAGHPAVAETLVDIGDIARRRGRLGEAALYHRRAIAILEHTASAKGRTMAFALNGLANDLHRQGRSAEAATLYRRALTIYERISGADHPSATSVRQNLAAALANVGRLDEAVEHGQSALLSKERVLEPNHPQLAHALEMMGNLHYKRREFEPALRYHRRALALHQRTLDSTHPDLATSYNNVALAEVEHGRVAVALQHYRSALQIWERTLGADHPHVASALGNIGRALQQIGEHRRALAYHERALQILERMLGSRHASLAYPHEGLGQALLALGRTTEAERHLTHAAQLRQTP